MHDPHGCCTIGHFSACSSARQPPAHRHRSYRPVVYLDVGPSRTSATRGIPPPTAELPTTPLRRLTTSSAAAGGSLLASGRGRWTHPSRARGRAGSSDVADRLIVCAVLVSSLALHVLALLAVWVGRPQTVVCPSGKFDGCAVMPLCVFRAVNALDRGHTCASGIFRLPMTGSGASA